jgi:hypothetical protein
MQKKLGVTVLLCLGLVTFLYVSVAEAQTNRLTQCDPCGLCKNTQMTKETGKDVYQRPSNWSSCMKCLFPDQNNLEVIDCPANVVVYDINSEQVEHVKCSSLVVNDAGELENKPKTGRIYSDIGCISTGMDKFIDPNASVDVVKRLLDIVLSVTGGIGLIFLIKGSVQLLTSRGNPENIQNAKKTIVNTIIGVLFAIFALLIFRFIAQETLRIPGLG